jgi:hypothetical protein
MTTPTEREREVARALVIAHCGSDSGYARVSEVAKALSAARADGIAEGLRRGRAIALVREAQIEANARREALEEAASLIRRRARESGARALKATSKLEAHGRRSRDVAMFDVAGEVQALASPPADQRGGG